MKIMNFRTKEGSISKSELERLRSECDRIIQNIQENVSWQTEADFTKYTTILNIDFSAVIKGLQTNHHIQSLALPVATQDILVQTLVLTCLPKLPLTSLSIEFPRPPRGEGKALKGFLSHPACKLTSLKFPSSLRRSFDRLGDTFIDDVLEGLKENKKIETLLILLTHQQQARLVSVLENFNCSLKYLEGTTAIMPELQAVLERNQQLKEMMDVSFASIDDLNNYIQKIKTTKHPTIVKTLRQFHPNLGDYFLENDLLLDVWYFFKSSYLKDVSISLLLAEFFFSEALFEDAQLNQLIVLYFALSAKHILYQQAIEKAKREQDPIPVVTTLEEQEKIIQNIEKLIATVSDAFVNNKKDAKEFIPIENAKKIVLQKTHELLKKHSAIFSNMDDVTVFEQTVNTSDYKWFVDNVYLSNDNNNQLSAHATINLEQKVTSIISQTMHRFELSRVLQDDSLVLTETYLKFLLNAFETSVEKLQVLDDLTETEFVKPREISFSTENTKKPSWWLTKLPLFKPNVILDPKNIEAKINVIKEFYLKFLENRQADKEAWEHAKQSPLLQALGCPITKVPEFYL